MYDVSEDKEVVGSTTGLKKLCPRCGRAGTVFIEAGLEPEEEVTFVVVWEGKGRNPYGSLKDFDCAVTIREVFNPDFGCGYDQGLP